MPSVDGKTMAITCNKANYIQMININEIIFCCAVLCLGALFTAHHQRNTQKNLWLLHHTTSKQPRDTQPALSCDNMEAYFLIKDSQNKT